VTGSLSGERRYRGYSSNANTSIPTYLVTGAKHHWQAACHEHEGIVRLLQKRLSADSETPGEYDEKPRSPVTGLQAALRREKSSPTHSVTTTVNLRLRSHSREDGTVDPSNISPKDHAITANTTNANHNYYLAAFVSCLLEYFSSA